MTTSGISFELHDTKVSVGQVKLGSEVKDFCSDGFDKRVLFQLNREACSAIIPPLSLLVIFPVYCYQNSREI